MNAVCRQSIITSTCPLRSNSSIEVEHGSIDAATPCTQQAAAPGRDLASFPSRPPCKASLDTLAFLAALACIPQISQITNGWAQSARSFRVAAFGNRQRCRRSVLPVVIPTRHTAMVVVECRLLIVSSREECALAHWMSAQGELVGPFFWTASQGIDSQGLFRTTSSGIAPKL